MTNPAHTIIDNVHVFDDDGFTGPRRVTLAGDTIHEVAPSGTGRGEVTGEVFDGRGRFLMPGLIDAHAHVTGDPALAAFARWGVTTVLDMGCADPAALRAMRERRRPGDPDLLMAGLPASAAGGLHTKKAGFPAASIVTGPDDASRFVAEQAAAGADYIKVIVEDPRMPGTEALPIDTVAAIVAAAHAAERLVVAHAVTAAAFDRAGRAGVDVITHAPLDRPLDPDQSAALAAGTILVPTLVMMRESAATLMARKVLRALAALRIAPRLDVRNAIETTRAWHSAGGVVAAGTDANEASFPPGHPDFGVSVHDELELLTRAGLDPLEALRAATSTTADAFQLTDRGRIRPGMRADVILLERDPTVDLSATRAISACWIHGVALASPQRGEA